MVLKKRNKLITVFEVKREAAYRYKYCPDTLVVTVIACKIHISP
jgi:hypothetical protein